MKFLDYVCHNFGFADFSNDFLHSLIHFKFLLFTLPSSVIIFGLVEKVFGISAAIFVSFIALAILELITGLAASRIKKIKFESKKIGRFGLKILVWLTLIGVVHSFVTGYASLDGLQNLLILNMFQLLHGVIVVYVSLEYLISVLENLSVITGQSNNKLLTFIKRKFDGFLGDTESIKLHEEIQEKSTQKQKEQKETSNNGSFAITHQTNDDNNVNSGDSGGDSGDGGGDGGH